MVTIRSIRRSYCGIEIKLREDRINRDLRELGDQQRILKEDAKSTNCKKMIVKMNYIKIWNSCSLKVTTKRVKGNPQSRGRYLQCLELANVLYPEYYKELLEIIKIRRKTTP